MHLQYTIDKEHDRKFLDMATKSVRENFDEIYRKNPDILEYTRNEYQKSWDMINDDFSAYISRMTSYDWFYDEYECVVSVAVTGVSNWGESGQILRGWKENAFSQRRITAHELILSHYFEIHKRHFSHLGLTDNQIWALAEIASFALTSLTPESKTFWPWDFSGYYTNHNYPQIVDLQNQLKEIFLNMQDFNGYVLEGARLVKGYKDEELMR